MASLVYRAYNKRGAKGCNCKAHVRTSPLEGAASQDSFWSVLSIPLCQACGQTKASRDPLWKLLLIYAPPMNPSGQSKRPPARRITNQHTQTHIFIVSNSPPLKQIVQEDISRHGNIYE